MPRVLPDTNVLFPFSLMDLFLALAEDCVIDLVLTDRLLAEWQRVIVREGHRTPEIAEKIAGLVRAGFASSFAPSTPASGTFRNSTDPTLTTCTTWPPPSQAVPMPSSP